MVIGDVHARRGDASDGHRCAGDEVRAGDRHSGAARGGPGRGNDVEGHPLRELRGVAGRVRRGGADPLTRLDRRRQRHVERSLARAVRRDLRRADVGLALQEIVRVRDARGVRIEVQIEVGRGRRAERPDHVCAARRQHRRRRGDDRKILIVVRTGVGVAGVVGRDSVAAYVDAQIDTDALSQLTESVVMNRVAPDRDVGDSGVVDDHAAASVVGDHVSFAGVRAADLGVRRGPADSDVPVAERQRPGRVRADEVSLNHEDGRGADRADVEAARSVAGDDVRRARRGAANHEASADAEAAHAHAICVVRDRRVTRCVRADEVPLDHDGARAGIQRHRHADVAAAGDHVPIGERGAADRDVAGVLEEDPVATVRKRRVARRVDADEATDDRLITLQDRRESVEEASDREAPNGDRVGGEGEARAARHVRARQGDLEHRVRARCRRIDRSSRLRVAVDRDRVEDGLHAAARRRRDRADTASVASGIRARDVERDRVGAGIRIGVEDRLSQRPRSRVVRVRDREGGGGGYRCGGEGESGGNAGKNGSHGTPFARTRESISAGRVSRLRRSRAPMGDPKPSRGRPPSASAAPCADRCPKTLEARIAAVGSAPRQSEGRERGWLLQVERLRDEDGHLSASVVVSRAVIAAAAAAGDQLGGELLDPVGEGRGAGHVCEDARAVWRHVCRSVLGLEQENGHLRSGDRARGAVIAAAAASRDTVVEEILDEGVEKARTRDVGEGVADVERPDLREGPVAADVFRERRVPVGGRPGA